MNIWMLDPRNYSPYYNYSLCCALRAQGCQVRLITSPFPYDRIPNRDSLDIDYFFHRVRDHHTEAYNRVTTAWSLAAYPIQMLRLIQRAITQPPDILHVQWTPVPWVDVMILKAFRSKRHSGPKLVCTVHNVLPHERRTWHGPLHRSLYHTADQLIVHSRAAAHDLTAQFRIPEARIHVIPHGNLLDFAHPVSPSHARRILQLAPTTRVLLFFGILRAYKGLEQLLHAMPRVRSVFPDVRLLIVGHVHRKTKVQPYRACIERLKLGDVIEWHPQYVPHMELGVFFGAADLVVLPYTAATDSGVLITAYTFGRPVVASATGGLPEAVEHGRSGLLIPPGDVEALADAIIQLLADEARRKRMGEYARHLAETRHAWPGIARKTLEVYCLARTTGNRFA